MILHAVLISFVLLMVFGMRYHLAADLAEWRSSRQWSGIATALAIALFAGALIRGATAHGR